MTENTIYFGKEIESGIREILNKIPQFPIIDINIENNKLRYSLKIPTSWYYDEYVDLAKTETLIEYYIKNIIEEKGLKNKLSTTDFNFPTEGVMEITIIVA